MSMEEDILAKLPGILAGLRGIGTGATAGLLKYPVAAGLMGATKLSDGKGMSWDEAMEGLNTQEARDAKEHPIADGIGKTAGVLAAGTLAWPATVAKAAKTSRASKAAAPAAGTSLGMQAVRDAQKIVEKTPLSATRQALDKASADPSLRQAIFKNDERAMTEALNKHGFKNYDDYIQAITQESRDALNSVNGMK